MTSDFSVIFKKYSMPAIFLVAGLGTLYIGVTKDQGSMFMVASILMFIAGAASLIYSSGKLKSTLIYVFGGLAAIAAAYTFFVTWNSVDETMTYNENYKKCKEIAKQNLQDVRFVQKLYAEKNGVYISNWDDLVTFVKEGKVNKVVQEGVVPAEKITSAERDYLYHDNRPIDENMTEQEAYLLSLWKEGPRYNELFKNFVRDTIEVSLLESKFLSTAYQSAREKQGLYPFSADSLPIIPFTNGKERWIMETADSVLMGESKVPALYIHGFIPFAEYKGKNGDKEEMHMGTLSSNNLSGSWEE